LLVIFSTLQPWYFFSVSVGFGAFYGPTFSAIGAFQVFIFRISLFESQRYQGYTAIA